MDADDNQRGNVMGEGMMRLEKERVNALNR